MVHLSKTNILASLEFYMSYAKFESESKSVFSHIVIRRQTIVKVD